MSDLEVEVADVPAALPSGRALFGAGLTLALAAGLLTVLGQPWIAAVVLVGVPFVVATAFLARPWVTPGLLIALTLAATMFSGRWPLLGSPLPLDRALFAFALASIWVESYTRRAPRVIRWRAVHVVLALLLAYATVSAFAAGSLTTSTGFFSLLDRLGVVPMVLFTVAGLAFHDRKSRNVLLVVLVVVGGYLSITAFLESTGLTGPVWPRYIVDPNVGIQFGRARGPFVESVAMGLALFECAVAGGVAFQVWRSRAARLGAAIVSVSALLALVLTLTRAVWLGAAFALVIILLVVPALRRRAVPAIAVAAVTVGIVILTVPGLSQDAGSRVASVAPIWDRLNTNRAALAMVESHPLFGIGWNEFVDKSPQYLRQGVDYPLTGTGIEVHNVLLSHAAELGLVGAALWVLAAVMAVGHALVRPASAELQPWRIGLLAVAIQFAVVAAFGPLSYPFPNLLLWLWAGIVLMPYITQPNPERTPGHG